MPDDGNAMPTALRRALELLAQPPAHPDVAHGYLDLIAAEPDPDPGEVNSGWVQRLWASRRGAAFYDRLQALSRLLFATLDQSKIDWLGIPQGGVVVDIGCGPGNITSALAQAVGPDGLALGIDLSGPMLARAVRTEHGPNIGFLRADAQRLPLRDNSVDAVVSTLTIHLVPDPHRALVEMARVLRPGGRVIVAVPTAGRTSQSLLARLPQAGAHAFIDDELSDALVNAGFIDTQTDRLATFQWVRGQLA